MGRNLRKSGIDIIGDVSWGTHFCNFYQTKQDLLAMIVPFFTAGLESNEFCLWVVSDPLDEQEAKRAAASAIPDFDHYFAQGQIEIVPHNDRYCHHGKLHLRDMAKDWIMKTEDATSLGYDGIRATGNTAWLEQKDWVSFMEYEAVLNEMSEQQKMILLCPYALSRCRASDVIDVVNSHQFALFNRDGQWEMVQTVRHKKAELYCAQRMDAVGKLASGLAHEINNQLTVIQASVDLYIRDDSLNYMCSKIGKAVKKASLLNHQLMMFASQQEESGGLVDINQNPLDLFERDRGKNLL